MFLVYKNVFVYVNHCLKHFGSIFNFSRMAMASSASTLRLVDIGCNLTVDQFSGEYHGKTVHSPDLDCILARAALNGVRSLIVTGGTYLT